MKRSVSRILPLLLAGVLLCAAGCAAKLPQPADAYGLLQEALQKSIAQETYYWKETRAQGKDAFFTSANVLAQMEKGYEVRRNAAGEPERLQVQVVEKKNDKMQRETWCGISRDTAGAERELYMMRDWQGDAQVQIKKIQAMRAVDYWKNPEFDGVFALSAKLAELSQLTAQDMDFANGKITTRGAVTTMTFQIKADYFARVEKSMFANSKSVTVELLDGRVSELVVYVADEEAGGGLLALDKESSRLSIVYIGPRITLPWFDDARVWNDDPIKWSEVKQEGMV